MKTLEVQMAEILAQSTPERLNAISNRDYLKGSISGALSNIKRNAAGIATSRKQMKQWEEKIAELDKQCNADRVLRQVELIKTDPRVKRVHFQWQLDITKYPSIKDGNILLMLVDTVPLGFTYEGATSSHFLGPMQMGFGSLSVGNPHSLVFRKNTDEVAYWAENPTVWKKMHLVSPHAYHNESDWTASPEYRFTPRLCLGQYSTPLQKVLNEGNFHVAIQLMFNFLETANPNDAYVQVHEFPIMGPKGKLVFLGIHDQHPKCKECGMCLPCGQCLRCPGCLRHDCIAPNRHCGHPRCKDCFACEKCNQCGCHKSGNHINCRRCKQCLDCDKCECEVDKCAEHYHCEDCGTCQDCSSCECNDDRDDHDDDD